MNPTAEYPTVPGRDETFRDQVAIVSGSSQGIGKAIASRLAQTGAKVMLTARTETTLTQATEQMRSLGGIVAGCAVDLATAGSGEAIVAKPLPPSERSTSLFTRPAPPSAAIFWS